MSEHRCEVCGHPAVAGRHATSDECITALRAERDELQLNNEMANGVIAEWGEVLEGRECLHGKDAHKDTPPMFYREATLCAFAKLVEQRDEALALVERLRRDMDLVERSGSLEAARNIAHSTLALTPSAALAEHDARVIERCAQVCASVSTEFDGAECYGGDIDRPHAGDTARGADICEMRIRALSAAPEEADRDKD